MPRTGKKPFEAVLTYFRSVPLAEADLVFHLAKVEIAARREAAAIITMPDPIAKPKGKKRGPKPGSKRGPKPMPPAETNEGIDPAPASDPKV